MEVSTTCLGLVSLHRFLPGVLSVMTDRTLKHAKGKAVNQQRRGTVVCPGEHFVGAFGAQQSVLESVLLKRRIMGPSWISLHCPTRVDASRQARPCSHACTSPTASNLCMKPYPSQYLCAPRPMLPDSLST